MPRSENAEPEATQERVVVERDISLAEWRKYSALAQADKLAQFPARGERMGNPAIGS